MSEATRLRALVIVGDSESGRSLERGLRELGYDVELSSSALQGIDAAQASPPQLIVLDLAVGGGGGLALLQVLRRSRSTRAIPVLIVGLPGGSLMEQAYALHAAGPFAPGAAVPLESWVRVATSRYATSPSRSSAGSDGLAAS